MSIKQHIKSVVFFTCKWLGFFHISKYLMRGRLLILGYHGFQLEDEAKFRPILFMCPYLFERRMAFIARHRFPALSLQDALNRLKHGTLPKNAVVITIDDGFFSVLDKAAPVLNRYKFPATLYVTSYYVAKGTPIFRLVVQYLFWKTDAKVVEFGDHKWSPIQKLNLNDSAAAYRIMWRIIDYGEKQCDETERQSICKNLASYFGLDYERILHSRMFNLVSEGELKQLEELGIDVQLHTHRHIFPPDKPNTALSELVENREYLQGLLGRSLSHFCYPSGVWDYRNLSILKKEGIYSATTCEPGLNTVYTECLTLYRFLDQDNLSDIEFEAELYGFRELIRLVTGQHRKTSRAHHHIKSSPI
jgi:peptidoglycan/xylan/chitin deacetylase (PgdA/CDA1 family)